MENVFKKSGSLHPRSNMGPPEYEAELLPSWPTVLLDVSNSDLMTHPNKLHSHRCFSQNHNM
jgi:hypothetical protein